MLDLLRRATRVITITLRRRGVRYFVYLIRGWLFPRLAYFFYTTIPHPVRLVRKTLPIQVGLAFLVIWRVSGSIPVATITLLILGGAGLLAFWLWRRHQLFWLHKEAESLIRRRTARPKVSDFTTWENLPVTRALRKVVRSCNEEETVLAHIDQDGRALCLIGPLEFLPSVDRKDFLERKRHDISLVLRDGLALIRKDFCGNRGGFIREWRSLAQLQGKARVPAIWHVDSEAQRLYINFIPGKTVREMLGAKGARIADWQTRDDPELIGLGKRERARKVVSRGTRLLTACLSEPFMVSLEEEIDAIHRAGITRLDLKFGNVILSETDGRPWFVDFEGVRFHRSIESITFALARDVDRKVFNRRFGRRLMTEASVRDELRAFDRDPTVWYAPIDFGLGLTCGPFWSTGAGTGRWGYFVGPAMPDLCGLRILDLGSNNGLMPTMMLRAGAREVVGLELSARNVRLADLVRRVFEWRDVQRYSFQVHNRNMLDILSGEWGRFDLITAFCSLYYLEADDMARVVRRAAELAPVMVVQANQKATSETIAGKAERASVGFLERLLRNNGFPMVGIMAPVGYARPLLIGRRNSTEQNSH